MATRKKAGTSVAKWDEELAQQAAIAAEMEANTGGGQFFSVRGGQLSWQDSPPPIVTGKPAFLRVAMVNTPV